MAFDKINAITFFAGEERILEAEVVPSNSSEIVVIREATWTLTDRATGEVKENGDCEIDGTKMTMFFGSETSGYFMLEVTAKVGRETIKQRCGVSFV